MSTKTEVSSSHTKALLAEHGAKKPADVPSVIITGTSREGSIGEAITTILREKCWVDVYDGDVRSVTWSEDWSAADTLIMCHGVCNLDWFEEAPVDKVREIIDVNLFGSYNVARRFVNQTIGNSYRKRIIMLGSMAYKAVLNGSAAYCASKAGLAHLAKCMAWELAPKGYDVFCIHPSNVLDAPMSEDTIQGLQRYRNMTREQAEAYWNDSMIRETALTKEEIVELIDFLLFGKSGYLSGTNLELAGGQR